MKRLLPLLLACLLLTGCGASAAPAASDGETVAFTDAAGREVSLPVQPQTVAVLLSSLADVWVTAGGSVDVTVGETVERGFAQEGVTLADAGAGHSSIDLEALVAAAPDLVIGTADYPCQAEACAFCAEHGIPAAALRIESFADYLSVLALFCQLTGYPENYEQYGASVSERISAVRAQIPETDQPPKVLFLRVGTSARSTKAKTAEQNFVCAMLDELGAENIADAAPVLLDGLSLEAVVQAQPDYIFLSPMGDEAAAVAYGGALLSGPGWRDLTAVQAGNYRFLPKELFHFKPNARWDDAYRILAEALYPEVQFAEN